MVLRHTLALPRPGDPLLHKSTVALRPLGSAAVLRATKAELAGGGEQLTLELTDQPTSSSSGGSGGGLGGGRGNGIASGGSKLTRTVGDERSTSSSSDSDLDEASSGGSSSGGSSSGGGAARRRGLRPPCLRLDVPPGARGRRDCSWQWRQTWSRRGSTRLAYLAASQQVALEGRLRAALLGVTASGSASLDGSTREVRKASLKLRCKVARGPGWPAQHLRLEAGWVADSGSGGGSGSARSSGPFAAMLSGTGSWTQSLRYSLGRRGGDAEIPRGFLELGLSLQGGRRRSADVQLCLPL